MWDWDDSKPPIEPMTLQRIIGTVGEYGGQPQITVKDIEPVDESTVDMSEYVPCAELDIELTLKSIYTLIYEFENLELSRLCEVAVERVEEQLRYYPAAVSCHDAVRGGLIHHTYSMLQCAMRICSVYPSINSDLLFAGVILHDLAKIDELETTPLGIATGYTPKGNLIGHLVLGAMKIDKLCDELNISDENRMLVEHMLLSHHGKPEYGAAKVPMLLEAQVLNLLDELDAKVYEFNEAVKDTEPGTMSPKVFPLGNISVYRPTT